MNTRLLLSCASAGALWFAGAALAAPAVTNAPATRINADSLEFDYEDEAGIIYLKGHVVVRDPKGTLSADQATVYLEKSSKEPASSSEADLGSFSRIVAVGKVKISSASGDRVVIADKATWTRKDNVIILTGGPPIARQGPSYMKATRMVYNMTTRKIECFPEPVIMLNVPEDQKQRFIE